MAQSPLRESSLPASLYSLGTPPSRRHGEPINIVMRGRRFRYQQAHPYYTVTPTLVNQLPTPTEPSSSPQRQYHGRSLHRTYSFLEPFGPNITTNTPPTNTTTSQNALGGTGPSDDRSPFGVASNITEFSVNGSVFQRLNLVDLNIPVFSQPMSFEDYISLRVQLDVSEQGVSQYIFRSMFGQCSGCERFMLKRSKDHHRCPGRYALPQLVSEDEMFPLLDSTAGGQGLTANQFSSLFLSCPDCGHIFLRERASGHNHEEDNVI